MKATFVLQTDFFFSLRFLFSQAYNFINLLNEHKTSGS